MFLTVHSAAAVIVSQITPNPLLAFILALISHFILDLIPHGDQEFAQDKTQILKKEKKLLFSIAAVDIILMSGLLLFFYLNNLAKPSLVVIAALTGALLPDFLSALFLIAENQILKKIFYFQNWLHYLFWGFTVNFKIGLIIQLIFLLGFLALILK